MVFTNTPESTLDTNSCRFNQVIQISIDLVHTDTQGLHGLSCGGLGSWPSKCNTVVRLHIAPTCWSYDTTMLNLNGSPSLKGKACSQFCNGKVYLKYILEKGMLGNTLALYMIGLPTAFPPLKVVLKISYHYHKTKIFLPLEARAPYRLSIMSMRPQSFYSQLYLAVSLTLKVIEQFAHE